jgi:hypothetical protein
MKKEGENREEAKGEAGFGGDITVIQRRCSDCRKQLIINSNSF